MAKPYMAVAQKTIPSATGKIIFSKIKYLFLFLWFGYLLLYATIISIEAGSIDPGLKDIGSRLVTPTIQIQKVSLEIIEQGGIYINTGSFFGDIWNVLSNFGSLFFNLYTIFIWLWLLNKIMCYLPLSGDSSRNLANITLSITFFFIIQIFYILRFTELDIMIPFLAFKDLFKALVVSIT